MSKPLFFYLTFFGLGVIMLIGFALFFGNWAQDEEANVFVEELMTESSLPERRLGNEEANITVIEYASTTCGACRSFHETTYPQLKEKYIDTGKINFILREFPRDPTDLSAWVMGRCLPEDKYFDYISGMMATQQQWAFSDKPYDALLAMAKQFGLTQAEFDTCLSNQELMRGIGEVRKRAIDEFNVRATPTFFINGQKYSGVLSLQQIEEAFEKAK